MTKTIGIGDRVHFTNPVTGQELIGTVQGFDPSRQRPWEVNFDSYMFRSIDTTLAMCAESDLRPV